LFADFVEFSIKPNACFARLMNKTTRCYPPINNECGINKDTRASAACRYKVLLDEKLKGVRKP